MAEIIYKEVKPIPKAMMTALIVFVVTSICIAYLSDKAQKNNRQNLEIQLKMIAEHAASLINGDNHEQLMAEGITGSTLYNQMVEPLVKLHNVTPEIHYIYTVKDTGSEMIFGLDTAYSSLLNTKFALDASEVGDVWEASAEEYQEWSLQLKNALTEGTHIDEEFSEDDFGNFLTASAPFFDSNGRYVGFVGVDIGTTFYDQFQNNIKKAIVFTIILSAVLSIIVAYFAYRNLNSIKKLQEKLYEDSINDPLTKCFNRRFFEKTLASNQLKKGLPYSLAILDIDHFKSINDTNGHDAGDKVLKTIVNILTSQLREPDQLFRIGGEEFAIIFNDCDLQEANKIAERCRQAVEKHAFDIEHNTSISVTISIGIVKANNEPTVDIVRLADKALYQAKENGRNQIEVLNTE